jgi:diacylglycerol kinase family enzyme
MRPPVVQLFVNPAAGSVSRRRVEALIRAFEAAGAHVLPDQGGDTETGVAPETDLVCIVGGDGTLRHVAEIVARAGRQLPLSIYPAGTVNLLARECGYTRDPQVFARRVLARTYRRHHVGRIGDIAMFTCASVGPDSLAVAALSDRLKTLIGRAAYVAAFVKVLIDWPRPAIRILHDGHETACEAVYIAKGRFFAGPWSFAPDASVEQPLLQVVALTRARRRDYARFVWALWRGQSLADKPDITCFTCTELTLTGHSKLPLQADGDIVACLPATLKVAPETLFFA